MKSAQGVVEDIPTIQAFLDEPVSDDDLQKIVNAGINSQSAMNGQPWHFSVVTNKAVEANLLGYGAKIISSPTIALNGDNKEHFKKILGIPEDMSAKAVLIIGKYDQKNLDAVTGATTRKDKSEVVTFVK